MKLRRVAAFKKSDNPSIKFKIKFMENLSIKNFKAFWDADIKFGRIDLFFTTGQEWKSPNLPSDEVVAMLSIPQFLILPGIYPQVR